MKTIKKIIVATDFSDASRNAFNYAYALAEHFNADIELINVYLIVSIPSEDYGYSGSYLQDLDDSTTTELKVLAAAMEENTHSNTKAHGTSLTQVKVNCKALPGFAADKLVELSFDPSTDLIVLGAVGEHSRLDKFFGSVAAKVAREAHCLVLLVPKNTQFHEIHHIVYACSEASIQKKPIHDILEWAKYFTANVQFLHIKIPEQDYNYLANTQLLKTIINQEKSLASTIVSYSALDVKTGLNSYAAHNKTDLLAVVTQHRGFWENIQHKSTTSDLVWDTTLPILVLHGDDQ